MQNQTPASMENVDAYNDIIEEFGVDGRVHICEVEGVEMLQDGHHLSSAGHEHIAFNLEKIIQDSKAV